MSDRVNRIIISKQDCWDEDEFYKRINEQLTLLMKSGYCCLVSDVDPENGVACIEFNLRVDPQTASDIALPCWLFPHELDYLSLYQMSNDYLESKDMVESIEKDLGEELKDLEELKIFKKARENYLKKRKLNGEELDLGDDEDDDKSGGQA